MKKKRSKSNFNKRAGRTTHSSSKQNKPPVQSPLDLHNISSYLEDYSIIAKYANMPYSKREWIETTRYELQYNANRYEHAVGAYLLKQHINFIHQAPFVICGKIYFLDFFIPSLRTAIEVDGDYHYLMNQAEKDCNREKDFNTIGIKTIRISNSEAKSNKYLEIKLKSVGIIR